jgi:uncharacterized protein YggE
MRNVKAIPALAVLAVAAIGYFSYSTAVAEGPSQQEDSKTRSISVSGTGSIRVKPDIATAVVGASKLSPKLADAKNACDQALSQIKAALKKQGVDEDDIQTVQYQIYRTVPNPNIPNSGPQQWKVVHLLQVRTKQPDKIATIVDAAVGAGATDVSSINFSVDSLAKHRTKSRELAVEAAKEKAMQLAALMRVQLGDVITVNEGGDGYYPAQMSANLSMDYAGAPGGMGSGISGGQIEVRTDVNVSFGIK